MNAAHLHVSAKRINDADILQALYSCPKEMHPRMRADSWGGRTVSQAERAGEGDARMLYC